ncbi:MAG: chromophore lyase CpcT/CpeT, partial [Bacteroidota bacterium]
DSLWIGKWRTPEAFDSISPNDLELREGCAVILQRVGDQHFAGQTNSDRCKSTLRGASYATSKVTILSDRIESWDQGFDSEGVQVWGAEQGGYVFDRINN